jgi:hypothetical protein
LNYLKLSLFLIFALNGLLFPLQVLTGVKSSPILLSIFTLIVFLFLLSKNDRVFCSFSKRDIFIIGYIIFFFFHELPHLINGEYSFFEFLRLEFLFIYPVVYYYIGRLVLADRKLLRTALLGIFFAALIGIIFMVYDNIAKMIFEFVPKYSELASSYTVEVNRIYLGDPDFVDVSKRGRPRDRSLGLLEATQISASFCAFGLIYFLASYKNWNSKFYSIASILYLFLIFLTMNYTVSILMTFIYFINLKVAWSKIEKRMLVYFIFSSFLFLTLWIFFDGPGIERTYNVFKYQVDLIFGNGVHSIPYLADGFIRIKTYFYQLWNDHEYVAILLGDGFSEFGFRSKGGDFGVVDSIARFGIVGSSIILYFYFLLVFMFFLRVKYNKTISQIKFLTSFYILTLILLCDMHYSVYQSKSIMPIIFFCIALAPRNKNIFKFWKGK